MEENIADTPALSPELPASDERLGDIPLDVAHESQCPASISEPAATELKNENLELPRVLAALSNQDFRYMWAGNFLSNVGTWMQNVALGWLVLELTNSAFWLGVVSFASAVPMLLFTLVGGVIADKVDKRKMLIRTQVVMMVSAFLLAGLTYTGRVTVTQIVLLAFATGVASALSAPSHQALVPQLVPKAQLTNAVGLNSAQFNMSRVIGPTLGGFAMHFVGVAGNFFLNGLSFLAVIIAMNKIKVGGQTEAVEGGFWKRLAEGFRYVFGNPKTSVMVVLVCIGALLGVPYFSFMPLFARDVLGVGERGLGLLMAFSGLGAFCAAVTIAYLTRPRKRGRLVLASGSAFFLAIIGFSFSRHFLVSAALQFVSGYAMILMVAIINTRLQHLVDDEMRGRTMSIYAMAYLGLPPVGSFMVGSLSHVMNAPHAIAAMAGLGLVLFLCLFALRSDLRRLD